MAEIQIAIKNKIPEVVGDVKCIVSDNSDYWVRFSFDDQWDDGEKTAYFVLDDGYAYPPATITDDVVSVPRQHSGGIGKRIYIGVSQGNTRTSQGIGLCVVSSITDMIDDSAVQPEPSMWEDVLKRLEKLEKNSGGSGGTAFEVGFGLSLEDGVLFAEVGAASFHEITNEELQEIINKVKAEG